MKRRWPWHKEPHRDWAAVRETGGREARQRAEVALEQTRAETAQYQDIARGNRRVREENHLGLAFLAAAERGPQ